MPFPSVFAATNDGVRKIPAPTTIPTIKAIASNKPKEGLGFDSVFKSDFTVPSSFKVFATASAEFLNSFIYTSIVSW